MVVAAGRRGGGSAQIDRLAVSQVGFHRKGFPGGPAAYRGYITKCWTFKGIPTPEGPGAVDDRVPDRRATIGVQPAGDQPRRHGAKSSTGNSADAMPNQANRGGVQRSPRRSRRFAAGTSNNIYDPVANLCAARNYLMFDPKYGWRRTGRISAESPSSIRDSAAGVLTCGSGGVCACRRGG